MPHVFVSYSKKDAAYARQLADGLLDAGFDVWVDTQRLRSGDEWWTVIYHAIQHSAAFIVVMSPNSDASDWVQDEIAVAKAFDKPLFPLLLAGDLRTPNWAKFLRIHYEDVTDGGLPDEGFYTRLGEVAPRKDTRGEDVTAPEAKASAPPESAEPEPAPEAYAYAEPEPPAPAPVAADEPELPAEEPRPDAAPSLEADDETVEFDAPPPPTARMPQPKMDTAELDAWLQTKPVPVFEQESPTPAPSPAAPPDDTESPTRYIADYYASAPKTSRSRVPLVAAAAVLVAVLVGLALLSSRENQGGEGTPTDAVSTQTTQAGEESPSLAVGSIQAWVDEQKMDVAIEVTPRESFDALQFDVFDMSADGALLATFTFDSSDIDFDQPVRLEPIALLPGHFIDIYVTASMLGNVVASNTASFSVDSPESGEAADPTIEVLQTLNPPSYNAHGEEMLSLANIEHGYTVDDTCQGFGVSGHTLMMDDSTIDAWTGEPVDREEVDTTYLPGYNSPDGRYSLTDNSVVEIETAHTLFHFSGSPALFSPDSRMVVVGNDGMYDIAQGQKIYSIIGEPVAFSPDGLLLAVNDRGLCSVFWHKQHDERVGYVTIVSAPVYETHNTDADIIAEATSDEYPVIERTDEGDFYRIILYEGDIPTGWVSAEDVENADIPDAVPIHGEHDDE